MKHYLILLAILVISCQDNYLTDLTPDTPHRDHFYFDSPAFVRALEDVDQVDPDTIYEIDKPEAIFDRSPFTYDRHWYTTDTFAIDPEDFDLVTDVLTSTVESRKVVTSFPSSRLGVISFGGGAAYSYPGKYWIIPQRTQDGQRWWIQITRTGTWWSHRYTANALLMEAKRKKIQGDVS